MQNAYNKLDIIVNVAVCTHYNMICILLKLANMNHIETRANCNIDAISG